jgi:sensor histidine kinase regulating citrate/malate metabolism
VFADNGNGYERDLFPDPEVFFELGIKHSSGMGYGIGLHHIREIAKESGGSAYIDTNYTEGFKLVVELGNRKED